MKEGNGIEAGKQPAKRSAPRGTKANGIDTAMASGTGKPSSFPDEQHRQISEAAYYRALERGFTPGGEADDWFQAEAELNYSLHMSKTGPF